VVYNTNAYDDINKIKKLNNLVDIYLPDFKYSFNELGEKYSKVKNYTDVSQECILEMIKQQPNNIVDNNIMKQGVVIRHLILPNNIENTKKCIDIINSFGKNIIFSLMTQYNPTYNADKFFEINRPVNIQEYEEIMAYILKFNFEEVFYQPFEESAKDVLNPDFNKPNPFNY
jgi:putative pyruvate formate lyase activating enzyme